VAAEKRDGRRRQERQKLEEMTLDLLPWKASSAMGINIESLPDLCACRPRQNRRRR
jgi:hypothetical protein